MRNSSNLQKNSTVSQFARDAVYYLGLIIILHMNYGNMTETILCLTSILLIIATKQKFKMVNIMPFTIIFVVAATSAYHIAMQDNAFSELSAYYWGKIGSMLLCLGVYYRMFFKDKTEYQVVPVFASIMIFWLIFMGSQYL